MRSRRWRFTSGRGDFLPIVIGGVMAVMSLPGFLLMLFAPDSNPGIFRFPVLAVLGAGSVFGIGFVIVGVRVCATPGSLAYRIARFRFFSR
ncbi:MAG TPA: hypothetical protein VMF86_17195 [Stellaceae bacterium]|nr:hypothetical protein [Stellaceae bacterium]